MLLLIADRYEILAPASVALALRIPVAHIEGGDISEGAIDDAVRNALTKLSHIHFTPTASARQRVLAMGEESWRVHQVGAPSLDLLHEYDPMPVTTLEDRLGVALQPGYCVVSCHPVTLLRDTLEEVGPVFDALARIDRQILFCLPNADAGSRELIARAQDFVRRRNHDRLFTNLPHRDFVNLLRHGGVLLGNSSAGIMEAPALELPTVNVGFRQQGRERARNIIDVAARTDDILAAVARAVSPEFKAGLVGMANPYGEGNAGKRIAAVLASTKIDATLLHKRALPLRELSAGVGNPIYGFVQDE